MIAKRFHVTQDGLSIAVTISALELMRNRGDLTMLLGEKVSEALDAIQHRLAATTQEKAANG